MVASRADVLPTLCHMPLVGLDCVGAVACNKTQREPGPGVVGTGSKALSGMMCVQGGGPVVTRSAVEMGGAQC